MSLKTALPSDYSTVLSVGSLHLCILWLLELKAYTFIAFLALALGVS